MIQILKPSLPPCPRCRGKMLLDPVSGDSTCFTCGHIAYLVMPLEHPTNRRLSHGGESLD